MGARYIWNRYTAIEKLGYRTRYSEVREDIGNPVNFHFNMTDGQTYSIGSGYSFSEVTGSYYTTGNKTYTYKERSGTRRGPGYITSTSGAMYYADNWFEHASYKGLYAGSNFEGSSYKAYKYTSESYQQSYTYYDPGTYLDQRSNASSGYYPYDDEDGGYYYVRQGSDQVDPTAVTVPDNIDDGTTIQISITPNTGKTYGGTISYTYQYRYDGGSWQDLGTTTATAVSLAVPKNQYSTLEVRVRAQDDMGFTSSDWITSGRKTIIANQPPTAPGISVENVYIGNTLTVTLTAATDPDGTVESYVIQRRIDGGAWTQVQAGTGMTYSETVSGEWGTVAYRAAAVDNEGLQGPWAASQTFDVNPGWVIISGPESDMGDKPVPFPFEFEVGVAGHPAEDNIITRVMLDGRRVVVDRTFHDHDTITIHLDVKYFAAGIHRLQITADKEGYTKAMANYTFNVPAQTEAILQKLEGCNAEIFQNYKGEAAVPFGLARFIFGDDGRDVNEMCGDGLKMAHGTYTGTGTSGQSNPLLLTCGFKPKVVSLYTADGSKAATLTAPDTGSSATAGGITATFSDSGVSLYAANAAGQFNASGTAYGYFIIG